MTDATTKKQQEEYTKETRVDTPWKPAKTMDSIRPFLDVNYEYKFEKTDTGDIQRSMSDDWALDLEISKKMPLLDKALQLHGGKSIDGTLIIGGNLVLMRIPKELAERNRKYYDDISNRKMGGIQQNLESQADTAGVSVYYPKK